MPTASSLGRECAITNKYNCEVNVIRDIFARSSYDIRLIFRLTSRANFLARKPRLIQIDLCNDVAQTRK